MTLFIATFSTLLAIINPLEALPVFLQLAARKDDHERVLLARRACLYAVGLMFFFCNSLGRQTGQATRMSATRRAGSAVKV